MQNNITPLPVLQSREALPSPPPRARPRARWTLVTLMLIFGGAWTAWELLRQTSSRELQPAGRARNVEPPLEERLARAESPGPAQPQKEPPLKNAEDARAINTARPAATDVKPKETASNGSPSDAIAPTIVLPQGSVWRQEHVIQLENMAGARVKTLMIQETTSGTPTMVDIDISESLVRQDGGSWEQDRLDGFRLRVELLKGTWQWRFHPEHKGAREQHLVDGFESLSPLIGTWRPKKRVQTGDRWEATLTGLEALIIPRPKNTQKVAATCVFTVTKISRAGAHQMVEIACTLDTLRTGPLEMTGTGKGTYTEETGAISLELAGTIRTPIGSVPWFGMFSQTPLPGVTAKSPASPWIARPALTGFDVLNLGMRRDAVRQLFQAWEKEDKKPQLARSLWGSGKGKTWIDVPVPRVGKPVHGIAFRFSDGRGVFSEDTDSPKGLAATLEELIVEFPENRPLTYPLILNASRAQYGPPVVFHRGKDALNPGKAFELGLMLRLPGFKETTAIWEWEKDDIRLGLHGQELGPQLFSESQEGSFRFLLHFQRGVIAKERGTNRERQKKTEQEAEELRRLLDSIKK